MSYQVPATQSAMRQSGKFIVVSFEVQELNNPDAAKIMLHAEHYGTLCFLDPDDKLENVELKKLPRSDRKSQSQRLRSVLFLINPSDEFYQSEMERIINHYREKIK